MPTLVTVIALGAMAAGYSALGWGLLNWESADPGAFAGYLILATGAAAVQITPSASRSALSPHLFFLLLSMPRLSFPEVIVIAAVGAIPQSVLWGHGRKTGMRTAVDVATLLTAATAAYVTAHQLAATGLGEALGSGFTRMNEPLGPLVLMLAGTVYALVKTVLDEALVPSAGVSLGEAWRKHHFWTLPHYAISGALAGLANLIGQGASWAIGLMMIPLLAWMFYSYRNHLSGVEEQRQQVRELNALHLRTMETLALAMDANDASKRAHVLRLGIYVRYLGQRLGLSPAEMEALRAASLLHDIGKLAVPGHIITKPGQLTEPEFERVKTHVEAGVEILEQVRFPYPVVPIVRAHHEKWDGTGYPNGLQGDQIPMGARILAVVDCLDALISDRNHRPACSLTSAIQHIQTESGKSFDPHVVKLLVQHYQILEARVRSAQDAQPDGILPELTTQTRTLSGQEGAGSPGEFLRRIASAKQEEQGLFHLARDLGNTLSLPETLEACGEHLQSMFPFDAINISIKRGQQLVCEFAAGLQSQHISRLEIPMGVGVTGGVAKSRIPALNADAVEDLLAGGIDPKVLDGVLWSGGSRGSASEGTTSGALLRTSQGVPGATASEKSRGLRSALAVPLESPSGVIGVITLYSSRDGGFTVDHLRVLTSVATKAALAVENSLKFSSVERSATTDNLTNLPNARSLFLHLDAELARARRQDLSVSVLVCDLDGFKAVNDELGHMEGNRVLRTVAQALKQQCREYDFVGRMGGDEFVVVMSGYRPSSLQAKMEQLTSAVEQAGKDAGVARLGISIGAASHPDDGEDAESLLAEADRHMYERKRRRAADLTEASDADLRTLRDSLSTQDRIH